MFYDISEDFDLIIASFAAQYGIRMLENKMTWSEFYSLLGGLMPETPIGKIIEIRAETDPNTLKSFNKEQHRIRNEWLKKNAKEMDKNEYEAEMAKLSAAFRALA